MNTENQTLQPAPIQTAAAAAPPADRCSPRADRTVIYHRADFDGIFCREIALRKFGDTAHYVGWDYGDPPPVIPTGHSVLMLDVSVPSLMDYPGLVWIDHHLSAMQKYGAKARGLRVEGVAACRLAWQYYFGNHLATREEYIARKVKEPLAVRLAGEHDVWDHRDPRAALLQHGLRSQEINFQALLDDKQMGVHELLEAGEYVRYAMAKTDASVIKEAGFTVAWEGYTWLALNTARGNSFAFTEGLRPEHDGCLAFRFTGLTWRVSLYGVPGKPQLNFLPIATLYGGGGHPQACGFELANTPSFLGMSMPQHTS